MSYFHTELSLSFFNFSIHFDHSSSSFFLGTISTWSCQIGDIVREDDVIVTLETDKVSVDVRSPFEGKLVGLGEDGDELLGEGEEVDVGSAIFQIDISFKAPSSSSSTTTEKKEVQKEKSSPPSSKSTPSTTQSQTSPPPSSEGGERGERRVKMSMMRRRIAERMKEAQETAAMLTTFQEVLLYCAYFLMIPTHIYPIERDLIDLFINFFFFRLI